MQPQVKAGMLRGLGVTGLKRSALVPDLPTVAESGFPGFNVTSGYSLLVPEKTLRAIVMRLFDDARRRMKAPDVMEALRDEGMKVGTSLSPEDFGVQIKAVTVEWAKIVKSAGIHAE